MRIEHKKVFVLWLGFFVVCGSFVVVPNVLADGETIVIVSPASISLEPGESGVFYVNCSPSQPVKAFELSISFNASLLSVVEVVEGDIFDGFTTFFSNGSIDNVAGRIDNIYSLIVGSGNVSSNGSLLQISFSAKEEIGSSSISLLDVGVTDESEYVSISVSDGSIVVDDATSPVIVNHSPSSASTGDSFTFNASVSDIYYDVGDLLVKVDWSHGSLLGNDSMSLVGGSYFEKTVTLDESSDDLSFFFYAVDDSGNEVVTSSVVVSVVDNDGPSISSVSLIVSYPLDTKVGFGWENVSCTVSDNGVISAVFVNFSLQNGSFVNESMISAGSGIYYINTTLTMHGNYSYVIYAVDDGANIDMSSAQEFSLAPNWDVNIDGQCDLLDLVAVSLSYNNSGNAGWIREDVINNGQVNILDLVEISNSFEKSWY